MREPSALSWMQGNCGSGGATKATILRRFAMSLLTWLAGIRGVERTWQSWNANPCRCELRWTADRRISQALLVVELGLARELAGK